MGSKKSKKEKDMAQRPVFISIDRTPYVATQIIDFSWVKGMAKSQARKRVLSLHEAANDEKLKKVLEISTASNTELGKSLSAFNLSVTINFGTEDEPNLQTHSIETIYQSSKVGQYGSNKVGPHPEWLGLTGKEVKSKIKGSKMDSISLYRYGQNTWPPAPSESFFTWLYINGLMQKDGLIEELAKYDGFTDIYFNPNKTNNCQARAAAQAVSMYNIGKLNLIMKTRSSYLQFSKEHPSGHVGRS